MKRGIPVFFLACSALVFASIASFHVEAASDPAPKAAAAATASDESGVYCMNNSKDVLAIRHEKDGSVKFSVLRWFANGSNFGAFGVAAKTAGGWRWEENMKSENPGDHCAVDISKGAKGDYTVTPDPKTPCSNYAGHQADMSAVTFPKTAYQFPVQNELDSGEVLQHAPDCTKRNTYTVPSIP